MAELEYLKFGIATIDLCANHSLPLSRLKTLELNDLQISPLGVATPVKNMRNFHSFCNAISEVCPNLEHLVLKQENTITGWFKSKERENGDQSYRWPMVRIIERGMKQRRFPL